MGSRAYVDDLENRKTSCLCQSSNPERPARSLSHQFDYALSSGVPRGVGVFKPHSEIPTTFQNSAKLNPIVKNC